MNSNSIPFTTFIKKIRSCHPGKIMNVFCIERNNSSFIYIIFDTIGFEFFKPFRKFLTRINLNFFPSRVTTGYCPSGANNIPLGYIHGYIIGAKFTVEFTFCMKWFIEPAIFIIYHNARIPLGKVILITYSPCSFRKFSNMLCPI